MNVDLLVEIAVANALRTFVENTNGSHHAARERQCCERRYHQSGEQQKTRPQNRCIQLCIHFGDRLFGEHAPCQRLDGCHRRQHLRTGEVRRLHGRGTRVIRHIRGFHMRQVRQVGLAEHEADVRIGDQEAVAVNHIGLALFADLDARHDIPDELEIDLRDRHRPGIAARPDGDRHVRLGLLAKVHGSEPWLSASCFPEWRLLRAVLARVDVVHAKTGNGDLLATIGIELRDIRDFRRLAQQFQEFDSTQLHIGGVELRQRGVRKLLLDLVDVLLDPRGRGDGLFVLQVRKRRLDFLIREIDADRAGSKQRARNQRQDEQQILAEQSAAMGVAIGGIRRCGEGGFKHRALPYAMCAGRGKWQGQWRDRSPTAPTGSGRRPHFLHGGKAAPDGEYRHREVSIGTTGT